MSTWSSYLESFYHSLLESQLNQRFNKRRDEYVLNNVVDTSCSNITLRRNTPKPCSYSNDYIFYVPEDIDKINQYSECKIGIPAVIHKSPGNHTSRRINSLLFSSGNVRNSLYTVPYELSLYTLSNVSIYTDKAISKSNLFSELQREIINSTDSVYLYDNNSRNRNGLKHVVIKPSGVLNAGIMGLDIQPKVVDDKVMVFTNEAFKVYPSCFFYYEKPKSDYFMDPYVSTRNTHKVECGWDGFSVKSRIYSEKNKPGAVHEDFDILEMKAENLSLYSSTIYARNSLGVFVFRHYFDGEWKIKPINNVSFTEEDKIYYMALSPYVPDDAVFLKTTNEMLLYDGHLGHERDRVSLSSLISTNKDIMQTVSYGMDNNTLILGGNKLYLYDRRANNLNDLILPVQSSITVTRVKWTERKYDFDYPSQHYKELLSGRNCSFSSYFRKSSPSFWGSFTACEVHPVYNYILAVVCGTSDSILLFDLRITNAPILDIPLPSTKFMGSRFRSLKWEFVDGISYLFAFSWRNKYPVVASFVIDSSFYNYTTVDTTKSSVKDFEHLDSSYDTSVLFDRSTVLNFSNTDQLQENKNFPSFGTTIKSEEYFDLPLQFTNDNAMTNIFHGYLGLTHIHFKTQKLRLGFAYTTSGRLICLDMDNRNVLLRKDDSYDVNSKSNKGNKINNNNTNNDNDNNKDNKRSNKESRTSKSRSKNKQKDKMNDERDRGTMNISDKGILYRNDEMELDNERHEEKEKQNTNMNRNRNRNKDRNSSEYEYGLENNEYNESKESKGNSQIDLEDDSNSFSGFRITCNDSNGFPVPDGMVFDKEFKYINVKKNELDKYNEFISVDLHDNFIKLQEQHFGDEKMYSTLSINNTYLNEENIQKYNSKEVLEKILEFNKINDDHDNDNNNNESILSIIQFDKKYGKERLNLYNHWNPLENRFDKDNDIDHIVDTDLDQNKDNRLLCSCSSLNELIDEYKKRLNENQDDIDNELTVDLLEKLLPYSISYFDKEKLNNINNLSNKNNDINNLNDDDSLVFDKGVIEVFGDMIMKNSNAVNMNDGNNDNNNDHRDDCRNDELVCVEVKDEKVDDNEEYHPLVNEIMSSWVVGR